MKKFFLSILGLYFACIINFAHARYIYIDFDQSMQKIDSAPISKEYRLYRDIYERNNPSKLPTSDEVLIPKIIHQIWLGPYKLPKEFKKYGQLWKNLNPSWKYKLWTEQDIENIHFPDKDLYDKASSYQEKAEILKYTILKNYGGLYVDVDFKPIRRFDYLHHSYKFYGGIIPPSEKTNDVQISTSIIGAEPNNLIISKTLEKIREDWDKSEAEYLLEKHKYNSEVSKLYKLRTERAFNYVVANKIEYAHRAIMLPPTYLNIIIRNKLLDPYLEAVGINARQRFFHIIHRETLSSERKDGTRLVENLSKHQVKENIARKIYRKAKNLILDLYHQYSY